MNPNPNDGTRPSHLQLARFATGELSDAEAAEVSQFIATSPEAQALLQSIEAAREEVPAFDMAALTTRAAGLESDAPAAPAAPEAANNNRAFLAVVPVMLLAAIALLVAWPMLSGQPVDDSVDPSYVGVRGNATLEVYHLEAAGLSLYDNRALGEGDVLGFRVDPAAHEGVVVLSVDGTGQISVHYPAEGETPEPIEGDGTVALPGSIILDGAPGPEVFVAVFGTPVAEARADAERAWQSGGMDGLNDWARASGVDLTVVNRK